MKYILTILSAVLIASSCTNNKARIVEQIKSYLDSIRLIEIKINLIKSEAFGRHDSAHKLLKTNFDADYKTLQADNKHNEKILNKFDEQEKKIETGEMSEKNLLRIKKMIFQTKIDSLNLELKKY